MFFAYSTILCGCLNVVCMHKAVCVCDREIEIDINIDIDISLIALSAWATAVMQEPTKIWPNTQTYTIFIHKLPVFSHTRVHI